MAAMRTALAASCLLTLLALAYLSASLLVLQPPRANFTAWFALASVLAALTVLTLTALRPAAQVMWLRPAAVAGAGILAATAVWRIHETLTSPHFEGYNLLLALILVVQSALTLAAFFRPRSVKTA